MKADKLQKPYWEMNLQELREATREFDQEFIMDTFRPMTASERKEWEQFQRRLKLTEGSSTSRRQVSARVPQSTVRKVDALAREYKVSRAFIVKLAIDSLLARKGASA